MIASEELPAIRTKGARTRRAAHGEPWMTLAGHRLVLPCENHPAEGWAPHGQQIDVLRDVGLVVAHRAFVRKAQILRVEHIDLKSGRRDVAYANAPRPGGDLRVHLEGGRGGQRSVDLRRPRDGAAADAVEDEPGPDDSLPTACRRAPSFLARAP